MRYALSCIISLRFKVNVKLFTCMCALRFKLSVCVSHLVACVRDDIGHICIVN